MALALALIFGILGAAKPHVHALEIHEHSDDDCGCLVEETEAAEEIDEDEEVVQPEENEPLEETEAPEEAREESGEESEQDSQNGAFGTPVYDEEGNLLYYEVKGTPRDNSAYQLTEEQLALPTDELLDLIINSPEVWIRVTSSSDLRSYDRPYHCARLNFNGIRELETRSDVAPALVAKLLEYFAKCELPHSYWELEVIEVLFE